MHVIISYADGNGSVDTSQKGLVVCFVPVAFASKTHTPPQSSYSNIDRDTTVPRVPPLTIIRHHNMSQPSADDTHKLLKND